MKTVQFKITDASMVTGLALPPACGLLLVFGARALLQDARLYGLLRAACPDAVISGCSTAGEIQGTEVSDDTIVLTAVCFEATALRLVTAQVAVAADSRQAGASLSRQLHGQHLRHILVFSDGLNVNGSELVQGLRESLPAAVNVTGGLAGDGVAFGETVVMADGPATSALVAAIGFYSERLRVGCGSVGGWDAFGPERLITRSAGNLLYELDGESALSLYKTYLGSHADQLPASALLFPLALRLPEASMPVVRAILAVDEASNSLTFAGDMPMGCYAQLMKANFNRLVDGAIETAEDNLAQLDGRTPELAILISCVGRKVVLQQRVEEETEGVAEILGKQAVLAGFYSYGEIAPHSALTRCELHNQTMTVTTFSEE
ncbi:MAG: FIST N-terminal domain-containing protein [Pseudomonadota bacterium]